MPQNPTSVLPVIINKAKGMNDFIGPTKLPEGFVTFELNLIPSGDVWPRRAGRDGYWLVDGDPVLNISVLNWADGRSTYVAQLGDSFYDITPNFSYYFRNNARLVIQAPGGQYWNVTPGFTTGLIFPTVVSTPSTAPQTGNLTVTPTQTISFQVDGGSIQLLSDFQNDGWYLESGLDALGFTQYTSDVVFTYASGFSLIIQDSALNNWKFSVSDIGELIVTVV